MKVKRAAAEAVQTRKQEDLALASLKTKPLKAKKLKKEKKIQKRKRKEFTNGARELSIIDPETIVIDEDDADANVQSQPNNESKIPKIRRSAGSSENAEENFMIVPWASGEEWDSVCFQFHERNYKDVIAKINVWQKRVPSLPVGVEATLFLLEALVYDEKLIKSGSQKVYYTEDQARSLYSLAIIRYLNHVSQLATQSLGGTSKKLTRELAAIVDTPEWLVALRNDVSHGPSAPSIEVLRMGGDFVLQWLKEKYWKLPEEMSTPITINDPFTILPQIDEVNIPLQLSELFAAYIAARIYKMRKQLTISDPEIIRHVTNNMSPVKTKEAVKTLKTLLRPFIISHPSLFCTVVSQELVPNSEFYEDFKSIIVKPSEAEGEEDVVFNKLYGIWMPIIKLLESKGKLITILNNLAEVVINPECVKDWAVSAKWIDKLLEIIEYSGKKYSKHLINILGIVIKHPNHSMQHFLSRLFRLTEPRLGSEAVQKLVFLASLWMEEDKLETKKRRKPIVEAEVKLFTLSDIDETYGHADVNLENNSNDEEQRPSVIWMPDERSEEFWRTIPIGGIL